MLSVEESLDELQMLAQTAGIEVVGQASQRLNKIDNATFIGSGKVEEVKAAVEELQVNVVIFDDELSPRHQRELEKAFGEDVKVLDRSALILDIFAQHASTHEGRLQVELAQYEYRLPRLTRQWTHLARQAGGGAVRGGSGGVGLRGPGETQLEVDRREINRRISKLKEDLEKVRSHRSRQRQQRSKTGMPLIALVGYTNAGKSTLMNAISGADTYVADQLFATLDTTTRRVTIPGGKEVLLADTVGFIQKLPTTLIEAFQATLEGINEADVILHVVDVSHPHHREHIETVEDTLAKIDVPRIPQILVLNKIDRWSEDFPLRAEAYLELGYEAVACLSALHQKGIDKLLTAIEEVLKEQMLAMQLLVPYQEGELMAHIRRGGVIEREEHTNEGVRMEVHVPVRMLRQLQPFQVSDSPIESEGQ